MRKNLFEKKRWAFIAAGGVILLIGLLGWGIFHPRPVQAAGVLRVAGALDLEPLASAIKLEFDQDYPPGLEFVASTSALDDLKAGRVEAALLGREPTLNELNSLDDFVVAYDAVCILVNPDTYAGRIQYAYRSGDPKSTQPAQKYDGLHFLSTDDLRGLLGKTLNFSNSIWRLSGPRASYYKFELYTDVNNNPIPDPDHPKNFLGDWVWYEYPIRIDLLPPGMFDTQSALLQSLVIPESALANPQVEFVNKVYDSEELLISRVFKLEQAKMNPAQPLDPAVMEIASRRVTVSALRHKFALNALPIDHVDPLSSPGVIYDGSYPLSRKIHLLLRKPYRLEVKKLSELLLSPQGQQLISQADFLPLPMNQ
jgi:hypothetical protein